MSSKTSEDEFGPNDFVFFDISAALSKLHMELDELGDLLADARHREQSTSYRPATLRRLGDRLMSADRKEAERASTKVHAEVTEFLSEPLLAAQESSEEKARNKRYHPLAPEQAGALVIFTAGPERSRLAMKRLLALLGDDPATIEYGLAHYRWRYRDPLINTMGSALLPMAVRSFYEMLEALVRMAMTANQKEFGIGQRTVTLDDMAEYSSQEDLVRREIDHKVDDALSGPPDKWAEFFQKKMRISLEEQTADWNAFREMQARRHAVIHAGGRVDQTYLDRLAHGAEKPALGSFLSSDHDYMENTFALLRSFSSAVAIETLCRLVPQHGAVIDLAQSQVLLALENERWHEAKVMASTSLATRGSDDRKPELEVNLFMARRELGEDWDSLKEEIEAWVPPNVKESEDKWRYGVAKSALLGDVAATHEALRARQRENPDLSSYSTWPLLKRLSEQSAAIRHLIGHPGTQQRRPVAPKSRKRGRSR